MAVPARRLDVPSRGRSAPRWTRRPGRGEGRAAPRRPVAQPRRARRASRLPFLLFSLAVLTAMILLLASAQVLVAQGSFRMAELTQRAEDLEQEYGRLRLRLARLSSPQRIVRAARESGLVLPEQLEILRVDQDGAAPSAPRRAGTLAVGALGGGEG